MRRVQLRIAVDVTAEDLDLIEAWAVEILDQVGLAVPLPVALQRLAAFPTVRIQGDRVHFDGDYILALLHSCRSPRPLQADSQIRVLAGGGALSIIDDRTGALRTATTDDLLRAFRICDRLGLGGDPPVIPVDIPEPLREVALYKLAWENTREFNGRDISSVGVGEYVYQMAQVAAKPFSLSLYIISPLRVNAENLALILHFADRLASVSVGTMPMPGATAPLLAPGYLAQALAEIIGGYAILSLLMPHAKVTFGLKLLAFDPYAGGIGCGSPESLLQGQLEVALLRRYDIIPTHYFWSMAGGCDAQAAAERMAGVLLGALAGVRVFGVAGRLQGEAFSLEQLLIDLEIAAYVERVVRGQAWDDAGQAWLAEVQDAVAEGTYLGSPGTVAHYRAETLHRSLFDRQNLAQRRGQSQPDLMERVRRQLVALDVPGPEYLSVEARNELNRIYKHAEACFGA